MLHFSLPHRYEDALVLLLTEVLNRIQFRYNQAQLEELDDETLDDDVSSTALLALILVTLWYEWKWGLGIHSSLLWRPSLSQNNLMV